MTTYENPAAPAAEAAPEQTVAEVLGSAHTSNFPDLLRQLGGCLVVSTYQAGKLVILRPSGTSINTHFRNVVRPMGMAADNQRLASLSVTGAFRAGDPQEFARAVAAMFDLDVDRSNAAAITLTPRRPAGISSPQK